MNWSHRAPVIMASFLASLVEFVEALTIVLAVGVTRGWRSAIAGGFAGILLLGGLVVVFGPALQTIRIGTLQIWVGILLLLFGMRWLRKAILRAGGVLGLHDETKIFARETQVLNDSKKPVVSSLDWIGAITSLKAVLIEGLEVVFIVIAVGATGQMLGAATLGALAAGLLVVAVGVVLHKPLAQVPENTLKFAVGILLSAFGVFWIGEGLAFPWPGEDWAVIGLAVGFLLVSVLAVQIIKGGIEHPIRPTPIPREHA